MIVRWIEFLVILNAAFLVIQSCRVIAVYSAVYSLTENKEKAQLPLHVWLIATSHLIYVIGTSVFMIVEPEPHGLARAIGYGIAGAIGQYALWNVLSYERRRYSKVTSFIDPE